MTAFLHNSVPLNFLLWYFCYTYIALISPSIVITLCNCVTYTEAARRKESKYNLELLLLSLSGSPVCSYDCMWSYAPAQTIVCAAVGSSTVYVIMVLF